MVKPPGDIHDPEIVEGDDGVLYIPYEAPDGYVSLGYCPAPKNQWQTFWYHVGHGIIMQYNLLDILVFAWRYRRWDDGTVTVVERVWDAE